MTTDSERELRAARLAAEERALRAAREAERQRRQARHEDYVYDKQQDAFWDLLDSTLHKDRAVNASIPQERWRVIVEQAAADPAEPRRAGRPRQQRERLVKPSEDICRVENDQFVESSTWWPGKPQIVHDYLIDESGFFAAIGRRSFNRYRAPPQESFGAAPFADPWVDHVKRLWPDEAEHNYFFDYCAHMVQRPDVKCNSGIILSGAQGIGKDAALDPIKRAVGSWNVKDIDPDQLFSDYRPWLEALMLVVDEARPSKDDFHSSSMYNILKPLTAAPPNVLPLNDKYKNMRYVVNVMRVFITTNDYLSLFIPAEDRRMHVMHSPQRKQWHLAEGMEEYFDRYWAWLDDGGAGHVAAWLRDRDLQKFNPKAQPPQTAGWNTITAGWSAPDDQISDLIEKLGNPQVVFGTELLNEAFDAREDLQSLMKSPRKFQHRMHALDYCLMPQPNGASWAFKSDGRRFKSRMAFVRTDLMRDPQKALQMLRERGAEIAARLPKNEGNVTQMPRRNAEKF